MTEIQHQESSPYTQSRTQKSPTKQHLGMRNYGIYSNNANIQLSYMKLREQSKKQTEANLRQIELLKQELYRKNQQIEYLKSTVIMNLKKDLNDAQRDNIKNFKQIERQARQIQKLRSDNFNMQLDLQKQSKQRRTYLTKLDDLKQIKEVTKRQILQKEKIIRTYADQNKKLQKQLSTYKLDLQDLKEEIRQKQNRLFESQNEYKAILQKCFVIQSELKTLQLRHRDNQLVIKNYAEKIIQYEKQKQQFLERIQQHESRSRLISDRQPDLGHNQILEVKSLMDQIYNLIEQKKQENKSVNKKFLASITCLERSLSKK